MANDVTIASSLVSPAITIRNAAVGTSNTAKVNVQNMIIAKGVAAAVGFALRIDDQTTDIANDTTTLESLRKVYADLTSWDEATWTDGKNRSAELEAVGLDLSADWDTSTVRYDEMTGFTPPTWNSNNYADFDYPPKPVPPSGTPMVDKTWYKNTDGSTFVYREYSASQHWLMSVSVADSHPFVGSATAAQIANWTKQVKKQLDEVSQLSQSKQAFLQDLISNYNQFFNFSSNNSDRRERDCNGILGRM